MARFDWDRGRRIGAPEVILGEGKRADDLVAILWRLAHENRGALVSRITERQRRRLEPEIRRGLPLRFLAGGRVARLAGPLGVPPKTGTVAVVAAGTSDVPVAEEAVAILRELGVTVVTAYDVGVAGLHRLMAAVRRLSRARPRAYLVFAGREGALPTVTAGLVGAPVLGIPTSVGYGRGARGRAALNAMLQSCAPLAVFNIDAATPAALFAAQWLSFPGPRARA